jgi:hypothetical protein
MQFSFNLCQRCGASDQLERHHWAPWAHFDDADSWPTALLCRPCHRRWHAVMRAVYELANVERVA